MRILIPALLFLIACAPAISSTPPIPVPPTVTPIPTPVYTPVPTPTTVPLAAAPDLRERNHEAQENLAAKPQLDERAIEQAVLSKLNALRTKRGLRPLAWDAALAEVVRAHNREMIQHDYMRHYNLEGQGPVERAAAMGIVCSRKEGNLLIEGVSENLYRSKIFDQETERLGITTYRWVDEERIAQEVIKGWRKSPSHNQVMNNRVVNRAGVGAVLTDREIFIGVNMC